MASTFLLLELTDPAVNAFLWKVRQIVSGRRSDRPVHVTLRGPYEGKPSAKALAEAKETLRLDVLRISGVGRFSNVKEEVVYFKVDSPNLRHVWWKPSYPVERYGFEPHISVYLGPDTLYADNVAKFLQKKKLTLHCAEYRLIWHRSQQRNLFTPSSPTVGEMEAMYQSNRIDVDFLDRLQEFVDMCRLQGGATRRRA